MLFLKPPSSFIPCFSFKTCFLSFLSPVMVCDPSCCMDTSVFFPVRQLCTFLPQPPASLSAQDQKKFKEALRVRRRENERLLKFMHSPQCMQHLWRIFYGEEPCERHSLYQSEVSRRSLLWTGMGPFQLDQSDDQVRCNVSGVILHVISGIGCLLQNT